MNIDLLLPKKPICVIGENKYIRKLEFIRKDILFNRENNNNDAPSVFFFPS